MLSLAERIRSRINTVMGVSFVSQANAAGCGETSLNYRMNGGVFIIKGLGTQFETRWSKAGLHSVYGYKDGVELLGVNSAVHDIPDALEDLESFDFSSRRSIFREGMVAVFMNSAGRFLGVKILSVNNGILEIMYRIY